MRGFLLILKAELIRSFIMMRRYWFAAMIGIMLGYGMLITLVYGLMFAAQEQWVKDMAAKAINGVLGFLVGAFAFGIVGMFTQGLQGMARTGELEQVCLSPFGLITNFMARSFVSAINSILSSAVMIILVAYTVGQDALHKAPVETILLLFLTYINLIGFGFMVGGLVLIFKQVGQVATIIRFIMLGLAVFAEKVADMPAIARWVAHALPITDAAICIKYVLTQGQQRLINGEMTFSPVFVHESFFFLLISCVVWTLIGTTSFRFMENWSRDKGTLGAY